MKLPLPSLPGCSWECCGADQCCFKSCSTSQSFRAGRRGGDLFQTFWHSESQHSLSGMEAGIQSREGAFGGSGKRGAENSGNKKETAGCARCDSDGGSRRGPSPQGQARGGPTARFGVLAALQGSGIRMELPRDVLNRAGKKEGLSQQGIHRWRGKGWGSKYPARNS